MSNRHRIKLSDPFNSTHTIDCCVRGPHDSSDPAAASLIAGRGGLTFAIGEFCVSLRPTADELRGLARAMLIVATELDGATPAPQAP